MITSEMIQAFLSVAQHRNITAAANSSFTTQSSLSKQIKALEEEVGTTLLIRRKGHSEIILTPTGVEFLKQARKWQEVLSNMMDVQNLNIITEISIGALDRMNSFTLPDLYRTVLDKHPDIRLDTHTRHSPAIYSMMEARQLDIGFVSTVMPTRSLKITPLFEEKMVVICNASTGLKRKVRPEDLDPSREVYSRWSDEFDVWHDQVWPGKQYRIHVGTSSMTPHFLDQPGRWAIVPVETLHGMLERHDFSIHQLEVNPPKRFIYLLEQKTPRETRADAIDLFLHEMRIYLANDPYISLLPAAK